MGFRSTSVALRGFVSLLVVSGLALVSCQPAPAQPTAPPQQAAPPTTAPAKPAEAAKPAATTAPAKPAEAPAAKPAEAKPAASPAAAAKPAEAKPAAVDAAELAQVVQKAGQEREVVAQMSDPLIGSTSEANRAMSEGLKKTFGVDINVRIDRAPNYPAATAKALSEIKSGGAPSYDLMYQTNLSGLPLLEGNAIEKFEWPRLFNWISDKDLDYRGLALVPHTRIVRPAYNTELVKGADVPKSWEDLVDPKWKGKIITTPYQDAWSQLAEVWGEERTLEYIKKLGALEPKLANFPEIDRRLIAGEVSVTALHLHHYIQAAKEAKAPEESVTPDPALVFVSVSFVPKGARHANAAALLNAWLLSEDGQVYSEKFYRDSSLFRPGTTAAKLAQSIKYVLPKLEYQMANTLRLQKQYEDIIVKR